MLYEPVQIENVQNYLKNLVNAFLLDLLKAWNNQILAQIMILIAK